MAIVAGENFNIMLTRSRTGIIGDGPLVDKATISGTGDIEGTDKSVNLNPELPNTPEVEAAIKTLLDAASVALSGKATVVATAVAAPKIVK
jgi:hypothetical protein